MIFFKGLLDKRSIGFSHGLVDLEFGFRMVDK
jgi:hypothetical protein